jgi:hypothetical protein
MRVTYFPDRAARVATPADPAPIELAEQIARTSAATKDALPWVKCATFGDAKSDKGSLRHDGNVLAITGAEGDYDAEAVPFDDALAAVRGAGLFAILYTSPSATATRHRWRILVPFAAPIEGSPERMRNVRAFYLRRLENLIGVEFSRESYTLSQAYYFGKVADNPAHRVEVVEGRCADETWAYVPTATPDARRSTSVGVAPAIEALLSGEALHPAVASLTQTLANRGLAEADIRALIEPLLSRIPRDANRLAVLAGDELTRAIESAMRKARLAEATQQFSVVDAERRCLVRAIAEVIADRRPTRWLVRDVLEERVLAVVAGPAGSFKSFWVLDVAMRAALDGRTIVLLSAEGAGLGRRVEAWLSRCAPDVDPAELRVFAVEMPLNLCGPDLDAVKREIEALDVRPDLVVIDTLSKYTPGLDENDNALVAGFLFRLSTDVRDAYGAAVVVVAHTGHGDSTRPRGASAIKANTDALYVAAYDAGGNRVTVTRDRFKDSPSLPPLTYLPERVLLSWCDADGEVQTSMILTPLELSPMPTATVKPGPNTTAGRLLAVLEQRQAAASEPLRWSESDLRAIVREEFGAHKNTAADAVKRLLGCLEKHWDGYALRVDGADLIDV